MSDQAFPTDAPTVRPGAPRCTSCCAAVRSRADAHGQHLPVRAAAHPGRARRRRRTTRDRRGAAVARLPWWSSVRARPSADAARCSPTWPPRIRRSAVTVVERRRSRRRAAGVRRPLGRGARSGHPPRAGLVGPAARPVRAGRRQVVRLGGVVVADAALRRPAAGARSTPTALADGEPLAPGAFDPLHARRTRGGVGQRLPGSRRGRPRRRPAPRRPMPMGADAVALDRPGRAARRGIFGTDAPASWSPARRCRPPGGRRGRHRRPRRRAAAAAGRLGRPTGRPPEPGAGGGRGHGRGRRPGVDGRVQGEPVPRSTSSGSSTIATPSSTSSSTCGASPPGAPAGVSRPCCAGRPPALTAVGADRAARPDPVTSAVGEGVEQAAGRPGRGEAARRHLGLDRRERPRPPRGRPGSRSRRVSPTSLHIHAVACSARARASSPSAADRGAERARWPPTPRRCPVPVSAEHGEHLGGPRLPLGAQQVHGAGVVGRGAPGGRRRGRRRPCSRRRGRPAP